MNPDNKLIQNNQRLKQGTTLVLIVLLANTLLVVFKYWIGLQLNSVAIMAEAWHGLSDSLTTIIVFIGFRIAGKPPDKEHPFGHGRMEVISSLVIAVILSLVSFNFFIDSVNRIIQRQSIEYNQAALIIFIASVMLKEFMAQISISIGRKIKSEALITDGWHHRSDAFASLIIIIGIFLNPYFWWIDGIMGIIISLIIAKIAYNILSDTVSKLIGEEPGEEFNRELKRIVQDNTVKNVKLHHIHLHRYGDHRELTFHIVLPEEMKLGQAHEIATGLEQKINSHLNVETTIHIESEED
ncbi:MAG: cation diffusion facilitator family transporter [Candidatus Caldatribacteriota bacterium]|nr:cation diffusion facilitator family transporter [Atribacterota bacterium]MDD3032264.1 cation diffusion facilitator family transporter [Atribacterota bacterium]MDD3640604.1 cation diffusion facilitator family transporter [Atribacterota bacterium]MDD4288555.1 cation diffusion facilitator family transporter [Atribacterota bacterium]MDD4764554.1 cation diffusion facilitator family transporter [Atribacterota bacterium]